jgi:hypothetical protein
MRSRVILSFIGLLVLSGCQTPPDVQTLQNQNSQLQQQLDAAHLKIVDLEAQQARLSQEKDELNRVAGVLGQEKFSRIEESTSLRGQVRSFVQIQIDELKRFVLNSNLVDYIGSEQVQRAQVNQEPLLLVDMINTVPADGVLTGVGGYFSGAGSLTVKVMRKVDGRLVVVWESQRLQIESKGEQRLSFAVSVGARKGDYLAYYIVSPGLLSFDTGTGDSRYLAEDVHFGASIKPSSLKGEDEKFAYSIGVYGLLNAP